MATCPLCGADAKTRPITGDHTTYECPNDTEFDVSGTLAQLLENNPDRRQSYRDLIARERKLGVKGVIKLRS